MGIIIEIPRVSLGPFRVLEFPISSRRTFQLASALEPVLGNLQFPYCHGPFQGRRRRTWRRRRRKFIHTLLST